MAKDMEEVTQGAGSVVVTQNAPKAADQTSNPVENDAEANDPPVRTNRPDVPIAQVLGAGAGAHEPADDPDFDEFGRYDPSGAGDRKKAAAAASKDAAPAAKGGNA